MLLYCIRHGESAYNAEGRVQGQSDVPLSAMGLRQSKAVAEHLAGLAVDALYSSPLRRAMMTAEVISRRLGLPSRTDPRLMEVDAGIFQDRLRSELAATYPDELARWQSEDPDYAIPGGESRRQLARRGREALLEIAGADHCRAAVVAHGRLLVVTMKSLLGIPPGQPPLALQNGSITTLCAHNPGRFELVALDQIDHLAGVGLTGSGDL